MTGRPSKQLVDTVRRRLRAYGAHRVDDPRVARAAVALILAEGGGDAELLLIHRATRDTDPWSGHMAFPGGRREPGDADIVATAVRETREEVGLDLASGAEVLGRLDELRAVARHRPLDLVITPVVFRVPSKAELRLDPREVASAIWVPLRFFYEPEATGVYRRTLDGAESEYPCYEYEGYQIWGLTYRILEGFLRLIGGGSVR